MSKRKHRSPINPHAKLRQEGRKQNEYHTPSAHKSHGNIAKELKKVRAKVKACGCTHKGRCKPGCKCWPKKAKDPKISFKEGTPARAKRDKIAEKIKDNNDIKEPFAVATAIVKGDKGKDMDDVINKEVAAEQSKRKKGQQGLFLNEKGDLVWVE